ncbi:MAG: DUF4440 domain-containing protein [Candidatus Glassbacteria bacterium]
MEKTETASDVQAIRTLHAESNRALSRGDLDTLMSVYADDVISMPANQPPRIGKAAVRSMWEEVLRDYAVESSVTVEEVVIAGDWAYERGGYNLKFDPRAGGVSIEDVGKYLDILQRQPDGNWKYYRVSWSSNKPAS